MHLFNLRHVFCRGVTSQFVGVLLLLILISGCSTILHNKSQTINIATTTSEKAAATITPPNSAPYQIVIPNTISAMPSSFSPLIIEVSDPCFEAYQTSVNKNITPSYWANVFTYFIGFPIDYYSGYMWKYDNLVSLPLVPLNNTGEPCLNGNLADIAGNRKTLGPIKNVKFKSHRISAGVLRQIPSKRYTDESNDNYGAYIEYIYRVSPDLMTNVKLQIDSNTKFFTYDCGRRSTCDSVTSTDQVVLSFALRNYLHPASSFYVGLGIAQIFIDQDQNTTSFSDSFDFRGPSNRNYTTSAITNAVFLDVGWQSRSSKPALYINATLDFAELRLGTPNLNYRKKRSTEPENSISRDGAIALFKEAAVISNVSVGFVLTF